LGVVATALWTFPMTYHFFSRFPAWRTPGPVWRIVQWLLYLLMLLVFWPAWLLSYLGAAVTKGTTHFLAEHPSLRCSCI
jgi:hypothetical protein